ncbi:MAG: ATP-binding protein [Candidatus Micrarchaeota archaeon]|nr:ATP-binding protein [Candidatus Micrarchaeota archaeon]
MIIFIDRKEEMKVLEDVARSKKAELVLLYGRRRIGKSRLLVEFLAKRKQKDGLYFLSDMSETILDIFSDIAGKAESSFIHFRDWNDFFEFVVKSRHKIFVIDEFQYLYYINRAWPTILQRWWEEIRKTGKKIILCGSTISAIFRIASGYSSPLYGRKTREINIKPLDFSCMKKFLPGYSIEELIKTYAVTGGVPRYIEEIDPNVPLQLNLKTKVFEKTSFLYNEPMNLLFEEFRDPASYISILLSIASGATRFSEISQKSAIQPAVLSKYLIALERTEIIERKVPVTEKRLKSKNGRYYLSDNFYSFWLKFVFPNKTFIEQGLLDNILKNISRSFNLHVSFVFEDICRQLAISISPFPTERIGRQWGRIPDASKGRNAYEIDIIALNEKTKDILFAECKWQEKVNPNKILSDLKEKAQYVDWNKEKRKEHYAIFAKSFSTRKVPEGVILVGLKDMKSMLSNNVNER